MAEIKIEAGHGVMAMSVLGAGMIKLSLVRVFAKSATNRLNGKRNKIRIS